MDDDDVNDFLYNYSHELYPVMLLFVHQVIHSMLMVSLEDDQYHYLKLIIKKIIKTKKFFYFVYIHYHQ